MRKIICALGLTMAAAGAQADFIGIYAGAGAWNSNFSGDIGTNAVDVKDLGIDDKTNGFVYVSFEHPVPLLPNLKLQHTDLNLSGSGTLSKDFKFHNTTFNANTKVSTKLDLSHNDITLYYEVLDNIVSADMGVTLRLMDGSAKVTSTTSARTESINLDAPIPMLYGKVRADLPLSGLYAGASGNLFGFRGDTFTDMDVHLGYTMSLAHTVDLGAAVGYRRMGVKMDDLNSLDTDLAIDGIYGELNLHF